MRKTFLAVCVLAVLIMASCRPTDMAIPNTPVPSTHSVSPLPTPIAPQVLPAATPEMPPSPVSTPITASGIHFTATIGPTCPGPERPGQVCTQPYAGLFSVMDNTGAEVMRVTTDQNGQATIDLPPGEYTLTPKIEGRFPSGAPAAVTVLSGQYVEVSVELDTGIR